MPSNPPDNSYDFENLENTQTQFTKLHQRASYRLEGFTHLIQAKGFQNQGRILEVGCGQGLRTSLIASALPQAQVMGVDRSPTMVQAAREKYQDLENLSFQEADLNDFTPSKDPFDAIYARLVFMHLSNPQEILTRLVAHLKPGGVLLIEDADRDFMRFSPLPSGFRDYWDRVQAGQRRMGGDPNVGTKLATYMSRSGLQSIDCEMQNEFAGGEKTRQICDDLLSCLNDYLPTDERPEGLQQIQQLRELSQAPAAFFFHTWFVVSGRKPL